MNTPAPQSHTHTADYHRIALALEGRKKAFVALEEEMKDFIPRPLSDYQRERDALYQNYSELNPQLPRAKIEELVNSQIDARSKPSMQFHFAFSDRFETEFVTITLLSHALCEAVINAILAIGLAYNKNHQLFPMLEMAEIKEKWLIGPKSFYPAYEFPKDGQLYESLRALCKQRNALVHHKITLHIGGEKVLQGSDLMTGKYADSARWVHRFLDLPYKLMDHADSQIKGPLIFGMLLAPIGRSGTKGK